MPDTLCTGLSTGSLADAETAENDTQQVIGGEFTGDFAQCVLCQAQFLGK